MDRHAREWWTLAVLALALFGLLALLTRGPSGVSWNYLVGVLVLVEIYALFSLGLSLEFGYTGLLNFGHVASMGLGAYGAVLFATRLEALDVPLSDRLEGVTVAGALGSLAVALLAAAVVGAPSMVAAGRWLPSAWSSRRKASLALAAAAVAGVGLFGALFPLGPVAAGAVVVVLGVLFGMALAAVAGLLLGLPTVRLREDYLAIVTIGAAEILRSVFVNEAWLTQGTLGIQRVPRPLAEWARDSEAWNAVASGAGVQPIALAHAALGLVLVALAFFFLEVLARAPWGRVLQAIREDEDVAAALGKNVLAYKLQALMIGSAVAALAGILFAWHVSNVYPDHFPSLVTFFAFIIIVVGGVGSHKGALAGALLLWGVFELAGNLTLLEGAGLRDLAGPPQAILVGLLLIVVMMARPQGLLGRREELLFAK